MDLDAAGPLARTHATLPRGLSWHGDPHFEGYVLIRGTNRFRLPTSNGDS